MAGGTRPRRPGPDKTPRTGQTKWPSCAIVIGPAIGHAPGVMALWRRRARSIVIATCPRCGDVEVDPADIEVRLHPRPGASRFRFICPWCGSYVEKPADDPRLVALLEGAGARIVRVEIPAEAFERPAGPPLTLDDLLDLMLLLDRDDAVERLAAPSRAG
jgi:predicted RNA-binding Zn-ribbon protein involved in translation (DUF1610 family)